jgi:hypothetical protein
MPLFALFFQGSLLSRQFFVLADCYVIENEGNYHLQFFFAARLFKYLKRERKKIMLLLDLLNVIICGKLWVGKVMKMKVIYLKEVL